jgi:hypothetical protein
MLETLDKPVYLLPMLSVDAIIKLIGYADSDCFRTKESQFEPEAVQLFRFAKEREISGENFRVKGFYVLKTAAGKDAPLAARPAVCVAEAETPADAKKLHRRIWNLGNVPFLLVRLPGEWGCAKKRTQVKRDSERQSHYEYTCDPREEDPEEV